MTTTVRPRRLFFYSPRGRQSLLTFSRSGSAYEFDGTLWRLANQNVIRVNHRTLVDGAMRLATLIEPGATNQALDACNFPLSGSWWSASGGWTVTTAASALENQTAWRHETSSTYKVRFRSGGTLSSTREWMFALVENVSAIQNQFGIAEEGVGAVARAIFRWDTMTLIQESAPRGSGVVSGYVDYGAGPNGGRLVLMWVSGIPTNPGGPRYLSPLGNYDTAPAAMIIHWAGHYISTYFPGISPIVTTSSAVSRALDQLYTDVPITSADTWTLYMAFTHWYPSVALGHFPRVFDLNGAANDTTDRIRLIHSGSNAQFAVSFAYSGSGTSIACGQANPGDYFEVLIVNDRANQRIIVSHARNGVLGATNTASTNEPSPVPWRLTLGANHGGASNFGAQAYHTVAIARGVRTLEEMRRLAR